MRRMKEYVDTPVTQVAAKLGRSGSFALSAPRASALRKENSNCTHDH